MTDSTERTAIRAYEANDGLYYCLCDDRRGWPSEKIEALFYECDDEKRVTDSLTPEGDREDDAPVVGHIHHTGGEIDKITFDLSDWYDEDATREYDGLPNWNTRMEAVSNGR